MSYNNQGTQRQILELPPPPNMAIARDIQPKPASSPAPFGRPTVANNFHWLTNQTQPTMSRNYYSVGFGGKGCAGSSDDEEAEKLRLKKMKNRASAARSRAKALAYNITKEVEIRELKMENEILRRITKVVSVDLERKENEDEKPSLKRSFSEPRQNLQLFILRQ